MRIGIASDHRGKEFAATIAEYLAPNYQVSLHQGEEYSYSHVVTPLMKSLQNQQLDYVILICSTGVGMSMAANKFKGIRAVLATDMYTAIFSRLHNNANVICFGQSTMDIQDVLRIVSVWIKTSFLGGKYAKRVEALESLFELS